MLPSSSQPARAGSRRILTSFLLAAMVLPATLALPQQSRQEQGDNLARRAAAHAGQGHGGLVQARGVDEGARAIALGRELEKRGKKKTTTKKKKDTTKKTTKKETTTTKKKTTIKAKAAVAKTTTTKKKSTTGKLIPV